VDERIDDEATTFPAETGETPPVRLARNMTELLQELRVAQAGVQILFAFLLILPFSARWSTVTQFEQDVYYASFLLVTAAAVFIIGPSAYHRIVFRHHDRRQLIETSSRWAVIGLLMLSLGMTGVVLLITDVLYSTAVTIVVTACTALLFAAVWFAVPLRRRWVKRGREEEPL